MDVLDPDPLPYRSRPDVHCAPPDYPALQLSSSLLLVLTVLLYAASVASIVMSISSASIVLGVLVALLFAALGAICALSSTCARGSAIWRATAICGGREASTDNQRGKVGDTGLEPVTSRV